MQLLHSSKGVAVIQMQADGQARFGDGRLDQFQKIGVVGIGAGALGNLEDQGRVHFLGRFRDALNDLHVVHVESADGITAVVRLLKHFFGGNKCHEKSSPNVLLP